MTSSNVRGLAGRHLAENSNFHAESQDYYFNPAVEEIPEALSIRFNQMVYDLKRSGRDVIVLSLGEPYFDIPLYDFRSIDYVKGYHYSDSQGIPELRQKIAEYYRSRYGVPVDPEREILISAGSKLIIYMSMLATLQPGEEIAVQEPCWLSYAPQARLCGARTRFIGYDVPVRDFGQFLTPRTRMLILNNPNNPAGRVYSSDELREIYNLCTARRMYLLVDEAYSDYVSDGEFVSAGHMNRSKSHVIVVNSLSKNMGMSGWRIGYAISHPELIRALLKINQHLVTCAPSILLHYCSRYFDDILSHTLPQVQALVERRRRVAQMLDEFGLEALPGSATFYFFVSLGNYPGTSMDFAEDLLRLHGVCVVPGLAYGNSVGRFIRVSIGAESEDRILAGLKRIRALMDQTRATGALYTAEQVMD